MSVVDKFQEIIQVQTDDSETKPSKLNAPASDISLERIEHLLGEPLPAEIRTLYKYANGQEANSEGIFFGERFMSAEEISDQLEFSRSLIKPENKIIEDPEKSDELIKKIIDFYVSKTIRKNLFGIRKKWYKIQFSCSVGSYGGPYLYAKNTTTENEREIVNIDSKSYETIAGTIKEFHELEKRSYNWDELEFVVYSDGEYDVKRTFYDFDNQPDISSTPENAIRKKYFHYKWLPVFSDYGGNYIGIDLDPDVNGKKGQTIIFGRDEQEMFVFGNSLENHFDLILSELKRPGNKLLNFNNHLHDVLRDIIN